MNIEKTIKSKLELQSKKYKLQRELQNINKDIQEQEDSCSHIIVCLGYYDTKAIYRCLICDKVEMGDFSDFEFVVHAEDYLPQYDIQDDEKCKEKFDIIQTLALGLLKENNDMTKEELTTKLNNLIQESILNSKNKNVLRLAQTTNAK